jgi:DhnA family fructose-bisphosphate aldolase class Ia
MMTGKQLRFRRLTPRGGAVIVPMDHALFAEPSAPIQDLRELVKTVARTEADGILITPGMLEHVRDVIGRLGVILRVDGTHTRMGSHLERTDLITTVEDAVALGADMVVANIFVGVENEDFHLAKLGKLAADCRRFGMPLMGEMMPASLLSFHYGKEKKSAPVEQINRDLCLVSRLGAEIGADCIKTQYSGDREGFAVVCRSAPVPIWIAGGPAGEGEAAFLGMMRDAVAAGAQGAVIGRNVWGRPDPARTIAELCGMLHTQGRPA